MEQQKLEERRRVKELGIIQSKPKTQKVLLMEQWRERIKAQEKMARKKKVNATVKMEHGPSAHGQRHSQSLSAVKKGVHSNYLRSTKSFEGNAKTAKSKMKLLKSKGRLGSRSNVQPAVSRHEFEEKSPCGELQELESASKFEELQMEDAVLVKEEPATPCPTAILEHAVDHHLSSAANVNASGSISPLSRHHESKSEELAVGAPNESEESSEIGVWNKPKPKKLAPRTQKGYNFARHTTLLSRQKKAAHPQYSHHHHTSIYGQQRKKAPSTSAHGTGPKAKRIMSEQKRMFHKAATVHTMSKRDRLAANYVDRKANEPQVEAEKRALQKADALEAAIANYEQKCHDAQMMKQSSLDSFRKYQALITETQAQLEQRQREFEKYKKKQERILCQKTQELDKKSRALLNVPDRKQRAQIELVKAQNEELKQEFAEKERRYKSKIERLKKQNKKLRAEKVEIQGELKKVEKERLQLWNQKQEGMDHPVVTVKRERTAGGQHAVSKREAVGGHPAHAQQCPQGTVSRRKKKWTISKIDANRPKTQQTASSNPFAVQRESVHHSANDLFDRHPARTTMTANRANMMNSQSLNQMRVHRGFDEYGQSVDDQECDSSSSSEEDDGSSSEDSTKNGEDMHPPEVVVISNRSDRASKRPSKSGSQGINPTQSEQKEPEREVEGNHLPEVPAEFDPSKMTAEQYQSESVRNREGAIQRMQHPDGKLEQVYGDGSKLILFPNGTEKYVFGNLSQQKHKQIFVKFPNGDIKKILSDGSEVYFYAQNNIIHATKADGNELFYFESQHEIHFADNTKHILFADGTKKYIYPNGEEQCIFPDQ